MNRRDFIKGVAVGVAGVTSMTGFLVSRDNAVAGSALRANREDHEHTLVFKNNGGLSLLIANHSDQNVTFRASARHGPESIVAEIPANGIIIAGPFLPEAFNDSFGMLHVRCSDPQHTLIEPVSFPECMP